MCRAFAQLVALEDGRPKGMGRVGMRRDLLSAFARRLRADDVVVVEATGNAAAVVEVLAQYVGSPTNRSKVTLE